MKKIIFLLLLTLGILGCNNIDKKEKEVEISKIMDNEYTLVSEYKDLGITINFDKDRVYGFSGVNRYFGNYKIDGDKIKIGPLAGTRMAGPIQSLQKEQKYLKQLESAKILKLKENSLLIETADKTLYFEKK
ncbi:MAG: META domain-containing protein [Cetobacterium sp.]|uniref:META domain-containing protein n=1 Tax=Cetobacterium sp. TaxID=2071632 RepID=UPI002FC920A2